MSESDTNTKATGGPLITRRSAVKGIAGVGITAGIGGALLLPTTAMSETLLYQAVDGATYHWDLSSRSEWYVRPAEINGPWTVVSHFDNIDWWQSLYYRVVRSGNSARVIIAQEIHNRRFAYGHHININGVERDYWGVGGTTGWQEHWINFTFQGGQRYHITTWKTYANGLGGGNWDITLEFPQPTSTVVAVKSVSDPYGGRFNGAAAPGIVFTIDVTNRTTGGNGSATWKGVVAGHPYTIRETGISGKPWYLDYTSQQKNTPSLTGGETVRVSFTDPVHYVAPKLRLTKATTQDVGRYVPNGVYAFVPQSNAANRMDVNGGTIEQQFNVGAAPSPIQSYGSNATMAQRFSIHKNGESDAYELSPVCDMGTRVDLSNNDGSNGAAIRQWQWNGSSAERWRITDKSGANTTFLTGVYYLRSNGHYNSGIDSNGAAQGSRVHLWGVSGGNSNSGWKLLRMDQYNKVCARWPYSVTGAVYSVYDGTYGTGGRYRGYFYVDSEDGWSVFHSTDGNHPNSLPVGHTYVMKQTGQPGAASWGGGDTAYRLNGTARPYLMDNREYIFTLTADNTEIDVTLEPRSPKETTFIITTHTGTNTIADRRNISFDVALTNDDPDVKSVWNNLQLIKDGYPDANNLYNGWYRNNYWPTPTPLGTWVTTTDRKIYVHEPQQFHFHLVLADGRIVDLPVENGSFTSPIQYVRYNSTVYYTLDPNRYIGGTSDVFKRADAALAAYLGPNGSPYGTHELFTRWYTDADCTQRLGGATLVLNDYDLYAHVPVEWNFMAKNGPKRVQGGMDTYSVSYRALVPFDIDVRNDASQSFTYKVIRDNKTLSENIIVWHNNGRSLVTGAGAARGSDAALRTYYTTDADPLSVQDYTIANTGGTDYLDLCFDRWHWTNQAPSWRSHVTNGPRFGTVSRNDSRNGNRSRPIYLYAINDFAFVQYYADGSDDNHRVHVDYDVPFGANYRLHAHAFDIGNGWAGVRGPAIRLDCHPILNNAAHIESFAAADYQVPANNTRKGYWYNDGTYEAGNLTYNQSMYQLNGSDNEEIGFFGWTESRDILGKDTSKKAGSYVETANAQVVHRDANGNAYGDPHYTGFVSRIITSGAVHDRSSLNGSAYAFNLYASNIAKSYYDYGINGAVDAVRQDSVRYDPTAESQKDGDDLPRGYYDKSKATRANRTRSIKMTVPIEFEFDHTMPLEDVDTVYVRETVDSTSHWNTLRPIGWRITRDVSQDPIASNRTVARTERAQFVVDHDRMFYIWYGYATADGVEGSI